MIPPQPDVTGELPSPDQLKNKVLLKGKMVNFKDEEDEDEDEKKENEKVKEELKKKKKAQGKEEEEDEASKDVKRVGGSTAVELSELIHLKAVHFKGFAESKGDIIYNDNAHLTFLLRYETMGNEFFL